MRYAQLDSLRGLAACTVVLCHATNVLPAVYDDPSRTWWLTGTPLSVFRAGEAAVDFFFVLSGFVLVLPFLKGPVSCPAFAFRRICRIWIPYATAMVVAIACALWFHPTPMAGLSHWANQPIKFPTPGLMLNHFFLVGTYPNDTYNPVIWSLVYEMRISLIFPLLVLFLKLGAWWRVLTAAMALSAAELAVERMSIWSGSADLPMTLNYAGLFVVGMLLAREMPKLREFYGRCSTWTKSLLWMVAFACYTHQAWLFPHSRLQRVPLYRDGLIASGVALFIIFACSPSRFSIWLESRLPVFLGKISYSLYLYHAVILLSLLHLFYGKAPLSVIWLATALLSIGMAMASYYLVEVPSIRLGKMVSQERPSPVSLIGEPFVKRVGSDMTVPS